MPPSLAGLARVACWTLVVGCSLGDGASAIASSGEASVLMEWAELDAGLHLAFDVLSRAETEHGLHSVQAARALDVVARGLREAGHPALALDRARRALSIKEATLPPGHPEIADSLHQLGRALLKRDGTGFDSFLEALVLRESALPPEHPDLLLSRDRLGRLLEQRGRFAAASEQYACVLEAKERSLGRDCPDLADAVHKRGRIAWRQGRYWEARRYGERASRLGMRLGAGHPDATRALQGLAIWYELTGEPARALTTYERALQLQESRPRPRWRSVAALLNNLGVLLTNMGEHERGLEAHWRSLELRQTHSREEIHQSLQNLGVTMTAMGRFEDALALLEQARLLKEQSNRGGLDVANTLIAMASVRREQGELGQAADLVRAARRIHGRELDASHVAHGTDACELGSILVETGDYRAASELLQEGLSIQERALGRDHPMLTIGLIDLARASLHLGDVDRAFQLALRGERVSRRHARATARAFSERRALRLAELRPSGLDVLLAVVAGDRGSSELTRTAWDEMVRSRALVLDELTMRRALIVSTSDPSLELLAREAADAARHLSVISSKVPSPSQAAQYGFEHVEAMDRLDRAERALADHGDLFRRERLERRVGLGDVLDALPRRSALVSFVRHRVISRDDAHSESRYTVLVARSSRDEPVVVPLGPAEAIDELADRWLEVARLPATRSRLSEREQERALRDAGRALRIAAWDPVVPHLRSVDRVFVVPDGQLHLVNLPALPDGASRYLVESGPVIHHLTAERDLVVRPEGGAGDGLLAVGAPLFDSAPEPPTQRAGGGWLPELARTWSSVFRGGCLDRFEELPGAATEVAEIAASWNGSSGGDALSLIGGEAREDLIKRHAPGRRVLHVATHGYWCPAPEAVTNPLLQCGLALTGANERDARLIESEDGMLTAGEIAMMDLSGLEWAVLSACDSGLGESRSGEGVLGLRRAFRRAGARTVITSLLPVGDQDARRWMRDLYRRRFEQQRDTATSVREASLAALEHRRAAGLSTHPIHWGGFVATGDWR